MNKSEEELTEETKTNHMEGKRKSCRKKSSRKNLTVFSFAPKPIVDVTGYMSRQEDFVLKGPPLGGIPPECSLGEYILSKARSHPQSITIQVDAETGAVQTLGEFLANSIRLSEGLKNLGVEENDVVGMMCRNSFEADEIVLGTWLTGAVIAPLPTTMTVGEYKHSFGITKPKLIFCEEETVSNVTGALNELSQTSRIILVGDKNSNSTHMRFREVFVEVDVKKYKPLSVKSPSSQLVAILSSSGTSGLPKGVGLTHANLIFQDFNMASLQAYETKKGVLQVSQFFWVTGVLLFLRCMTTGTQRVLLRDPTVPNCLKAIDQYKPGITLVAPLYVMLMATHTDFDKVDVSSIEKIFIGGSPFIPSIGEKIKEKWPEVKLIQVYGTTEVSGTICCNTEGDPFALGKVTPGVQLKIIDTGTGKSLKPNVLGEILIKTPGLMVCYVGNEKAYQEAVDADGWFHTADLGYHNDSGQVYLVDRMKEMVKIMNMQISPSEVENAVLSISGVVEAAVTGVTRDGNVYELLALVVKDKNSTVTAEDIHTHIASTLSSYKSLTGGVFFLDSLPKTPSGKINRNKVKILAQNLYLGQ